MPRVTTTIKANDGTPITLSLTLVSELNTDKRLKFIRLATNYKSDYVTFSMFPNARLIDVSLCQIKQIDISGCKFLTHLICSESHLHTIDIFGHPTLRIVIAEKMPHLSNMFIQQCRNLEEVRVNSQIPFALDLTGCKYLSEVYASNTKLVYLSIVDSPKLEVVDIRNSPVKDINFYHCSNAKILTKFL